MKSITIRPYIPADFAQVLALINAAALVDRTRRITDVALQRALIPSRDREASLGTVVALNGNSSVTGFAWWDDSRAHTLRAEGWVHPSHRRRGVGTALVTAAEVFGRKYVPGGKIGWRAFEDIPGVEPLFRLKGYTLDRRFYVMSTSLKGREFNIVAPQGMEFRSFQREDLDALVEADNEIFSDHWGSAPRSVGDWKRDMMDTRPHNPTLWIIAWLGDSIMGECLCHTSREGGPNDGWVSVVGVRRQWRGRGLGRAILARGLKELQKVGFETANLSCDSENIAAVNLYRSLEMDVVRTRLHFVRTLGR